jgi:putative transposase
MYSYEDRLRAVRLYIKLGRRVGLTIRQLGYPTKNALKTWCREYEQSRDLPAGYVRQPKYTPACKERAVEHYLEHGRCIAATVKALGYPPRTLLDKWKNQLLGHNASAPMKRKQVVPASADHVELEQQLEALRADIRRLQLEKDLLKKANEVQKKNWASTSSP